MFETVNRIYKCSSACNITVHEVFHQETYAFSHNLTLFQRDLVKTEENDAWSQFIGRLKRYRFFISASPLPYNSSFFDIEKSSKFLTAFLEPLALFDRANSSKIEKARHILSVFKSLAELRVNAIADKYLELISEIKSSADMAVVLIDNILVKPVKEFFASERRLKYIDFIFTAHDLKGFESFERLFVFGSPDWFSRKGYSFLFSAPRSMHIDVLSYSWLDNKIRIDPIFDYPQVSGKNGEKAAARLITLIKKETPSPIEIIESEKCIPVLDIIRLKKRMEHAGIEENKEEIEDIVGAKIVILSHGKAVYVEESDTTSSFVLHLTKDKSRIEDEQPYENEDFESDTEINDEAGREADDDLELLGRCLNSDLEPGMFILLRTGGGGDYILTIGDRVLGGEAMKCRSLQKEWKAKFRQILREKGPYEVQNELRARGGIKVHPATLLNWIRERNIRPASSANFSAILSVIGLSGESEKYFKNTGIILSAHRKAGNYIRKLLLDQIKKSDLKNLIVDGYMDFKLPVIDSSASMGAFRIEAILPEIHQVPYYRLGHAVDVGEDLWH